MSPPKAPPPCSPGSALVTLVFRNPTSTSSAAAAAAAARELVVDRALLFHASPVLRGLVEDVGGGGGGGGGPSSLPLPGEDAELWEVALQLLQHEDKHLAGLSWENVAGMCHLAHKYGMSSLQKACLLFLTAHLRDTSLFKYNIESPKNLLHAASLAERYLIGGGGDGGLLLPFTDAVEAAAKAALPQPVKLQRGADCDKHEVAMVRYTTYSSWRSAAYGQLRPLKELMAHPKYDDIVTSGVQCQVARALLGGMEALILNM
ncbi:hypothetical protein HXX76_008080 [Chlamydomonas incerta]|uniref:BTB domain-containing protein n=1 Tax=Chlamydomonas incerta TaxID=51695 RepID=A0A835SYC1_CHLIN|nr:hypothetical protein HXX76_008080 [Chlamydomonas incerta]|eukprot:KAG2433712.1 hypothetical protein HXX76_008080 [Chlamydomonas incerta]